MPGPQTDGSYDFSEPFDAKAWAMHHDKVCALRWTSTDFKLGMIMKAGGGVAAGGLTVMIALLGWSLKTNYDNMEQLERGRAQIVQTVQQQSQQVKQAVAAQGSGS